jgi:hypothetical protein
MSRHTSSRPSADDFEQEMDAGIALMMEGMDPATRRLAEDIIAGQTIEIEGMTCRLRALRMSGADDSAEFPALGGTRGP